MKQSRLHLILLLVWASLVVPTLLWWRESVLWVSLMSLYANFVGHWSSYEAAVAAEKVDDKEDATKEVRV